jgi:hypothetical protein
MPQALATDLAHLVARHSLHEVVAALATLCRWQAHHARAQHEDPTARRWDHAGHNLAWLAARHLRGRVPAGSPRHP